MKMKKILAGVLAGAMTLSAVTFTSLTLNAAEEENVEVILNTAYGLGNIILKTNGTYEVNGTKVENQTNWNQIDSKTEEQDNEYTAAFGNSTLEGSIGNFTFKAPQSINAIELIAVMWNNDLNKNVAHEVKIDVNESLNGKLNVQLIPEGEVSPNQTSNWYYLQNATLKYVTDGEPIEEVEIKPQSGGGNHGVLIEELMKYDKLTFTYSPKLRSECRHDDESNKEPEGTYCIWSGLTVIGQLKNAVDGLNQYWYQPKNAIKIETSEDKQTITATVRVSTIVSSFENDASWTSECELSNVLFCENTCTLVKITGRPIKVDVSEITLPETLTLKKGEEKVIESTIIPDNATDKTLTWSTGDPEIATVDTTGKVTAKAIGETTITATAASGVNAECTVTVVSDIESISLNKTTLDLIKGDSETLTVTFTPDKEK